MAISENFLPSHAVPVFARMVYMICMYQIQMELQKEPGVVQRSLGSEKVGCSAGEKERSENLFSSPSASLTFCLCLSTPISLLLSSYFSVYLSLSLLPPHLSLILFFTSCVISPSLIHFLISTKEDRQFEETYHKSKQIV